jgi:hypothetical protein
MEIHNEHQREIERKLRLRSEAPDRFRRRSIRKSLGRALIQFGSRLASDAPLQLAARR